MTTRYNLGYGVDLKRLTKLIKRSLSFMPTGLQEQSRKATLEWQGLNLMRTHLPLRLG